MSVPHALPLALLLSLFAAACSDDSSPGAAPDEPMGTANGGSMSAENGAGGDMAGGDMAGGNGAGGSATGGGSENDGANGGMNGSNMEVGGSGGGAGTGFSERGVCGARAKGVVTAEDFQIQEEHYLLSEGGFGLDICVVRFDVKRVGDAPPGCDENAGQQTECLWTHLVQYSNPTVVLDENGVCANSELGMDAEAIAALDGLQVAYGYVFEYQGHNSVLMSYNQEQATWEPGANAGWDETSGSFLFDDRRGACRYGGEAPAP